MNVQNSHNPAILTEREPSPYGRGREIAEAARQCASGTLSPVQESCIIREICTAMHIIAETCVEQVFKDMDVRDFEFYQKYEIAAGDIVWELATLMTDRRQPSDSTRSPALLFILYNRWLQLFLDKMRSLSTKSSLMAITRVKHAHEHYGKLSREYRENNETPYVDADPTRRVTRPIDLDNPHVSITSAFVALRRVLENPPHRNRRLSPVLAKPPSPRFASSSESQAQQIWWNPPASTRECSPPAPVRAHSPPTSTRVRSSRRTRKSSWNSPDHGPVQNSFTLEIRR